MNIGDYSRGGKTRGDNKAADHDMGCREKYIPFGLVDEDSGQLHIAFGSSAKTSDFIVDCLYGWWNRLPLAERDALSLIQIKADNSPESSGRRTDVRSSSSAWWNLPTMPASLFSSCITRPITASTIRSSDAGAFWKNTGMAPNWSTWTSYWSGQKA